MNNASRLLLTALAVLSASWGVPQTPSQDPAKPETANAQTVDIVDTAAKRDDLKTFTSLVQKAGLTETLKGKGPFTVLAPTDEAFKKLPEGLLDKLGANPDDLKAVLTYHVLPEKVGSADLKDGTEAKTVQGESIKIGVPEKTEPTDPEKTEPPADPSAKADKEVTFNGKKAKIVKADIKASNGTIHTIDTVLVPPSLLKAGPPQP